MKDDLMRGPNYKLSGDVRRVWRCPICGNERKRHGDVTTVPCDCRADSWMQIVSEWNAVPRPIQRPSDIERHPIDFGIEPAPPAPQKTEATIVKSALAPETDPASTPSIPVNPEPSAPPQEPAAEDDDWGEGIF